jgi:tetratricopeptide (TPR) repeat protein
MRIRKPAFLGLMPVGTWVVGAEELPYKRLLQREDARKAAALQKRVYELWSAGKFAEAVTPAEELLALRQRVQGKGHWETGDATRLVESLQKAAGLPGRQQTALAEAPMLTSKAEKLHAESKYAEAEPLLRKALAIWEEVLGRKHPDTATSYNNLGYNLHAQGQTKEAEPLLRKALDSREEVLGPIHPDTATSYNNLAYICQAQGRAREAEPLYRKMLAIREEVLGPRHPETATSYNSLGDNLQVQGRAREAEPLYRKALAIREEVLGPKHPHTATSCKNLASTLQAQGRAREAESVWQKSAAAIEAARLRLSTTTLHQAVAIRIQPNLRLAACNARLHRPLDAWTAAEANLARGLLDDLTARTAFPTAPDANRRDRDRAARLEVLDRLLLPLLTSEKLDEPTSAAATRCSRIGPPMMTRPPALLPSAPATLSCPWRTSSNDSPPKTPLCSGWTVLHSASIGVASCGTKERLSGCPSKVAAKDISGPTPTTNRRG